jgi:uncharacterized protein
MTELSNLQPLFKLFSHAGWQAPPIPEVAHVVAYGQQLASQHSIAGVQVDAAATPRGIEVRIVIAAGVKLEQPVHLCFGLFEQFGMQDVFLNLLLQPGSEATLWAHGLFSAPLAARHAMQAEIRLMQGARLYYQEAHFHGNSGKIEVVPHAHVVLEKKARLLADFSLIQGRVGGLDIDYTVEVGESALAELSSRIYGFGSDVIRLREKVMLNGEGARGLLKSRLAVREQARATVISVMEGNAAGARGHVDCMEIVRDQAEVSAMPEVRVRHPLAKVTHEAAIGSVDSRQLETLMARGMAPDDAVDLIVRGMLA